MEADGPTSSCDVALRGDARTGEHRERPTQAELQPEQRPEAPKSIWGMYYQVLSARQPTIENSEQQGLKQAGGLFLSHVKDAELASV